MVYSFSGAFSCLEGYAFFCLLRYTPEIVITRLAPNFTLPNATGQLVTLSDILRQGPVILNFYRGGWCPYCNLELRAYQQALPQLKAAGADLLAISPQAPDASLSTAEKNELAFEVHQ